MLPIAGEQIHMVRICDISDMKSNSQLQCCSSLTGPVVNHSTCCHRVPDKLHDNTVHSSGYCSVHVLCIRSTAARIPLKEKRLQNAQPLVNSNLWFVMMEAVQGPWTLSKEIIFNRAKKAGATPWYSQLAAGQFK